MTRSGGEPRDGPAEAAPSNAVRRAADSKAGGADAPRWRVERPAHRAGPPRPKLPGGGWFWLLVLGMLVVNFALAARVPSGHPRIPVRRERRRHDGQPGQVEGQALRHVG